MSFDCGNRLIAALDVPTKDKAMVLATDIKDHVAFLKVGLELYCSEGASLVNAFREAGHRIMLDLKLHDIPATVGRATKRVASLGCDLLTIHSAGGLTMMKAAVDAANDVSKGTMNILAVTVLTSMDDMDMASVGATQPVTELVVQRALLAMKAGCHGVVASPAEASMIRKAVGDSCLIVTPGIRPAGTAVGDQKRVTTPAEARSLGADMVVVGRPIREASNPGKAASDIANELR